MKILQGSYSYITLNTQMSVTILPNSQPQTIHTLHNPYAKSKIEKKTESPGQSLYLQLQKGLNGPKKN